MKMEKTRYTLGSGWQMEGMPEALEEVRTYEELAAMLRKLVEAYWDSDVGFEQRSRAAVREAESLLTKVGG